MAYNQSVPYACPRCVADPQPPHFDRSRQCAFHEDGTFNPDNWNCATIAYLLGAPDAQDISSELESLQAIPAYMPILNVSEGDSVSIQQRGWLVMARQFNVGRSASLMYVGPFHPPRAVTLAMCDDVIASTMEHVARNSSQVVTLQ